MFETPKHSLDPFRSIVGVKHARKCLEAFSCDLFERLNRRLIVLDNWAVAPVEVFFLLSLLRNGSSHEANATELLSALKLYPTFLQNKAHINELVCLLRHFFDLSSSGKSNSEGGAAEEGGGGDRDDESVRSSSQLFLFYAVDKLVLHPFFVDLRKTFFDYVEVRSLRFEGIVRDEDEMDEEEAEEEEREEEEPDDRPRKLVRRREAQRRRFLSFVNRFVEKLTDGAVKHLLSRRFLGTVNVSTVEDAYLLCSTVSFRRLWRVGFDVRSTLHDVKFTTLQEMIDASTVMTTPSRKRPSSVVLVEMMSAVDYIALVGQHDWKGVKFSSLCIPFSDSRFVFIMLLPENAGVKQMNNLVDIAKSQGSFDRIRAEQRLSVIKCLQIPKFSVATSCQLKSLLEDMGCRSMFSSDDSDFYRIATTGHHVAEVLQRTELYISEDGIRIQRGDDASCPSSRLLSPGGSGSGSGSSGDAADAGGGADASASGGGGRSRPSGRAARRGRGTGRRSGRRSSRRGRRSRSGTPNSSSAGGVGASGAGDGGGSAGASASASAAPANANAKRIGEGLPEVPSLVCGTPFLAFVASSSLRLPLIYAKILKPSIVIDDGED